MRVGTHARCFIRTLAFICGKLHGPRYGEYLDGSCEFGIQSPYCMPFIEKLVNSLENLFDRLCLYVENYRLSGGKILKTTECHCKLLSSTLYAPDPIAAEIKEEEYEQNGMW